MTAKKSAFCYIDHKTGDHDHMNAHIRIASCDKPAMTAPVTYTREEMLALANELDRLQPGHSMAKSDTIAAMLRQAAVGETARPTCATCKHFITRAATKGSVSYALCEKRSVAVYEHDDQTMLPADGSGFCHLHTEAFTFPIVTVLCVCGHPESDHETVEYRGDKSRGCVGQRKNGCKCYGFQTRPNAIEHLRAQAETLGFTISLHTEAKDAEIARLTASCESWQADALRYAQNVDHANNKLAAARTEVTRLTARWEALKAFAAGTCIPDALLNKMDELEAQR